MPEDIELLLPSVCQSTSSSYCWKGLANCERRGVGAILCEGIRGKSLLIFYLHDFTGTATAQCTEADALRAIM